MFGSMLTRPVEEPRDFGHLSRVMGPDPSTRASSPLLPSPHLLGLQWIRDELPDFARLLWAGYIISSINHAFSSIICVPPSIRRRLTRARNTFIMTVGVASYR